MKTYCVILCAITSIVCCEKANAISIEEALAKHFDSAAILRTGRITGTVARLLKGAPLPSLDIFESAVSAKALVLKKDKDRANQSDESIMNMAREMVTDNYEDSYYSFEFEALRRDSCYVEKYTSPVMYSILPYTNERQNQEQPILQAQVGGKRIYAQYYDGFGNSKDDNIAFLNDQPMIALGDIWGAGVLGETRAKIWSRPSLKKEEFLSSFYSKLYVLEDTPDHFLIGNSAHKITLSPKHGFLMVKSETYRPGPDKKMIMTNRIVNSDFCIDSGVWFPRKSTIEDFRLQPNSSEMEISWKWTMEIKEFKANIPVSDNDLDFVIPSKTVVQAEPASGGGIVGLSKNFPMLTRTPTPFSKIEDKVTTAGPSDRATGKP